MRVCVRRRQEVRRGGGNRVMATRSLEVTRAIRDRVLDGTYPGGTRMNEIDLATSLGVSRTPIRGALSTLAAEGLLDYTPNSGYIVRLYTAKDIADIYTVRAELDGLATRLAAENGLGDTGRGTIMRILDESTRLIEAQRWDDSVREAWSALNIRFHNVIYDATANPFLVSLLKRATDIPIVSRLRYIDFDMAALERAHDDHVEIADAIVRRQGLRAEALEIEHVYRAGRRLVEQVRHLEARAIGNGQRDEGVTRLRTRRAS